MQLHLEVCHLVRLFLLLLLLVEFHFGSGRIARAPVVFSQVVVKQMVGADEREAV